MKLLLCFVFMQIIFCGVFADNFSLVYYLTSHSVSTKVDETTTENLKGYFASREHRHFKVEIDNIEMGDAILIAEINIKQLANMNANGLSVYKKDESWYKYKITIEDNTVNLELLRGVAAKGKPFTRQVRAVARMLDVNYGQVDLENRYLHYGLSTIKRSADNYKVFYSDRIEKIISGEYAETIQMRRGGKYYFEHFLTVQGESLGVFMEHWLEQRDAAQTEQ